MLKLSDIQSRHHGTDREIIADAVHPGDDYLVATDTYAWYRAIAESLAPQRILEFGVRYGYSGIAMIQGAIGAGVTEIVYTGVDGEKDGVLSNDIAEANLTRYTPHVSIIHWDTTDIWGAYAEITKKSGGTRYDIVHVDGDHSVRGVSAELTLAEMCLKPGGYLLVDDMDVSHIQKAVSSFYEKCTILTLPTMHRTAVVQPDAATYSTQRSVLPY